MSKRLAWTKLQDFYLRLGFLNVLVAVLSAERRSTTNDSIIRRLQRPLFDTVGAHSSLAGRLQSVFGTDYPVRGSAARTHKEPNVEVAEALIALGGGASALYGLTHDTAYKIVDWGRDMGLIGRANQITERGLILKSLVPEERAEQFLAGNVDAWDPFELDGRQRAFFTYYLMEMDRLTVEILRDLGDMEQNHVLESREAAQITAAALLRILGDLEETVDARDVQAFRVAVELAVTMAEEVKVDIPSTWARRVQRAREMRPTRRVGASMPKTSKTRRTTKNADHQTIPRFEQLVDLGFLAKPGADADDALQELAARRRWRYLPTDVCRRWAQGFRELKKSNLPFEWHGFARVAVRSFYGGSSSADPAIQTEALAKRLWSAYAAVGRTVGLSPLDSVALRVMIDGVADGVAVEMLQVHRLLTEIKQRNLLTDTVHFASGNALDKMFVRLKPDFLAKLSGALPHLPTEIAA